MSDAKILAFPGGTPPPDPPPEQVPEPFNFLGWVHGEVITVIAELNALVDEAESIEQAEWFVRLGELKNQIGEWPNG